MKTSGSLIAFEGIDGSGKSTVARHIHQYLRERGIITCFIESGGMPEQSIVTQVKKITQDPKNENMAWTTETLLYLASLAQRVKEYAFPSLQQGKIVLADRFTMSILVLAHYARGLERNSVQHMINFSTQGICPNLTILCDIKVSEAMKRQAKGKILSRKEKEGQSLFEKLRSGYLNEAKEIRDECIILQSDHLCKQEMLKQVEDIIEKKLLV